MCISGLNIGMARSLALALSLLYIGLCTKHVKSTYQKNKMNPKKNLIPLKTYIVSYTSLLRIFDMYRDRERLGNVIGSNEAECMKNVKKPAKSSSTDDEHW